MIGEGLNDTAGAGLDDSGAAPAPDSVASAPAAPAPQAAAPAPPANPLDGLSPGYFNTVGQLESSGGTQVGNGGGKYQFMPGTAAQYGGSGEDAMRRFTADNVNVLRKAGLPINDTTAYIAHQQGAGGASKLLHASPDAIAADVVGAKAAQGNKPFFYAKDGTPLTVAQSLDFFNSRVASAGGKGSVRPTPGAAPAVASGSVPAGATAQAQPTTIKDRIAAWMKDRNARDEGQPAPQKAAPEDEDALRARLKDSELPAVATVPLGSPVSGVVRVHGQTLFQRYGKLFDAKGNLVG
jgi:hypothetical protein